MSLPDISFVHLGLEIPHISKSFSIFGFSIAYYGVIVGLGFFIGICLACWIAKKENVSLDLMTDFAIWTIFAAIIGARAYYVIFAWEDYKDNLIQIFNLRAGGLAIYGGIIAVVCMMILFCKKRKVSIGKIGDCAVFGLVAGQIIGRWGNFVNCEAFGGYTDNLFAMQIRRDLVNPNMISPELAQHFAENPIIKEGIEYIQVHPTFLYESVWNLGVLILLLIVRKYKKFDGQMMCLYFIGYGIGRFWIEGLRTDQLKLFGTQIAVSQLLSAVLIVSALVVLIVNFWKKNSNPKANS
ncbi:MAG TPA: prolipoprotein diacylglyceryl transferase [Candidatus Fimimorpha faecalis]|uniref:Phosphatidylglycerol--prolipoprotein diacylglyceryl transferase n=1 Tax=Candidatus Fimimorpha faecalis TaxID=2840824 RepID=A0A9D1JET3_9FIRM|nr:prolipoprotein diacylglyceryl transferase [Candidatus Fimimorpha faecalis]